MRSRSRSPVAAAIGTSFQASFRIRPTCRGAAAFTRDAPSALRHATRLIRRSTTRARPGSSRRASFMIRPMRKRPREVSERWRDIAGPVGQLEPGRRNAITDVPGVGVGHSQAQSGQRTGVTVVEPPHLPAAAGTAVVNGTGELTSKLEVDETGWIQTPIYLCGTHALGTVYQAAIIASGRGPQDALIPVVGETDDGDLADSRTVVAGDVTAALEALSDDVAEGTVGAGTGMQLYGFAGGIGTASRQAAGWHVGILLQCNFGEREYLDVLGHSLEPSVRPAASD